MESVWNSFKNKFNFRSFIRLRLGHVSYLWFVCRILNFCLIWLHSAPMSQPQLSHGNNTFTECNIHIIHTNLVSYLGQQLENRKPVTYQYLPINWLRIVLKIEILLEWQWFIVNFGYIAIPILSSAIWIRIRKIFHTLNE